MEQLSFGQSVKQHFQAIRAAMSAFMQDREFKLSNPQLFTFLVFVPNALAIASDGHVDNEEITALEKVARSIDVNSLVSLDLHEALANAPEPMDCVTNEEFNLRVGAELLYMCRHMKVYEINLMEAVRLLLKFDSKPELETSLSKSFSLMMDKMVENNMSHRKEHEKAKLGQIKKQLGLL